MKRKGNLYERIISLSNLKEAVKIAKRGKSKQFGVKKFFEDEEEHLNIVHELLNHRKFKTSRYSEIEIFEPKQRIIARLPFYKDRLVHWAIMLHLRDIFVNCFISQTYSGIKGRGINKASYDLRGVIKSYQYCLKLDIKKFYENVDRDILKTLLRRKLKDKELLTLLDEIIDSYPKGLPLGSLLSQYFANFYLNYFDHYIKETLKVKDYFRYMDDLVILSNSKEDLHNIFKHLKEYLATLKLEIKGNYQVFPIDDRGIDFVGFRHYTTHTLLRKSIKKNYVKSKNKERWNGWLIHANTLNLRRKYENN